jgi:hypothetical protein
VAGRRSRYADDFILDDGGFADPRLGAGRACGKPRSQAKRGDAKNAVTAIHFIPIDLSRHRSGPRALTML